VSVLATRVLGDGGGPWVVWLHGFLGSSLDFLPFATQLAPRVRSLLVDLPAHGDSTDVEPESVAASAALVADAMADFDIDRAVLAGYSLGGRVALEFASQNPRRVAGLILESTSPGIVGAAARVARINVDERRAESLVTQSREEFLEGWYRQSVFRSLSARPADLEVMIATRRIADRGSMARALSCFSPGRQTPMWGILPRLGCPILALAGGLDGKYLAVSRRVGEVARHATVVAVPDSGHIAHFEAPEAYFAAIASFLDDPE